MGDQCAARGFVLAASTSSTFPQASPKYIFATKDSNRSTALSSHRHAIIWASMFARRIVAYSVARRCQNSIPVQAFSLRDGSFKRSNRAWKLRPASWKNCMGLVSSDGGCLVVGRPLAKSDWRVFATTPLLEEWPHVEQGAMIPSATSAMGKPFVVELGAYDNTGIISSSTKPHSSPFIDVGDGT